jgi:PIN domain
MMHYLFLDTQFFEKNAYDFQNRHFKQIRALAESEIVCLLMPEITRREIESHIVNKAKEAYTALDKFRRSGFHKNLRVPPFDAIAEGTTEDAIREELMSHFEEFCNNASVVHLPANGLDIMPILDDYFNQRPPFGKDKKKYEFPDAFAARLLLDWCEKHGRKAVVISGDGDWATIQNPRLEIIDQVAKFLDRFPDPIIANAVRGALKSTNSFAERVKRAFEETTFYDGEYDADIVDLEAEDVQIGDIYVTSVDKGMATVEAEVEISFAATARGTKRMSDSWEDDDNEDGNFGVVGRVSGTKSGTASVEVFYDSDDLSNIDYVGVTLTGMSPYINAGHLFE